MTSGMPAGFEEGAPAQSTWDLPMVGKFGSLSVHLAVHLFFNCFTEARSAEAPPACHLIGSFKS